MRYNCCARLVLSGACLVAGTLISAYSEAGDVADVVKDLYGGDGILLADIPLPPMSPPEFQHAPHFVASSLEGLDELNSALSANIGSLSFNSTVTGFTFDIERGVPVRATESLGPLLAERATTIGRGKLSIAVSYTRLKFDRFEGTDLNSFPITFTHDDVNDDGILGASPPGLPLDFETDAIAVDLDLDISQDILAFFADYGISDRWDVGVIVPVIRTRARAEANATIVRSATGPPPFPDSTFFHNFDPSRDRPKSVVNRDAIGVGDVILRTKYNILRDAESWPDFAVVGRAKLPTGEEDDLLGTGEVDVLGLLVVSKTVGQLTPHLNLGYEVSTDSERSNLRYVPGVDLALSPQLTFAVDVLGRWEPDGDDVGDHLVDLAFGAKWNPFDDWIVSGNMTVPMNGDQGLRSDLVWTVAAEVVF